MQGVVDPSCLCESLILIAFKIKAIKLSLLSEGLDLSNMGKSVYVFIIILIGHFSKFAIRGSFRHAGSDSVKM